MKPTHVFLAFAVRLAVALTAAAVVVSMVRAAPPAFTVTNRMPEFKVVNKCPAATKTVRVFSTRPAHGHTHTCAHGHTWDHDANPTHVCQFCGMTQYVQDRAPRPVTITRIVREPTDAPLPRTCAPPRAPRQTATVLMALPRASAGCVNGQCAYPR